MRARTESLGILRLPITWGWQSAWGPPPASGGAAACAQSELAGKRESVVAARIAARAEAMRDGLRRVSTDFSLMLGEIPLTRFTVKIRTPSLLSKSHPADSLGGNSIIWERRRAARVW